MDRYPLDTRPIQHEEIADWAIAELMSCIGDGSVDVRAPSHIALTNAINTYLLESGYTLDQLPDIWNGDIQITSS